MLEQTIGVDTFQLSPFFLDPFGHADLAAQPDGATDDRQADLRSRRISPSRGAWARRSTTRLSCSSSTQSDRLSWVFSRNEDPQTYALEFRVRHTF